MKYTHKRESLRNIFVYYPLFRSSTFVIIKIDTYDKAHDAKEMSSLISRSILLGQVESTHWCSVTKAVSEYSQENTCAGVYC